MGLADLIKTGSDYYGGYGECCPPVVDPYTYLALLAGIALTTWFLQMTIVMTMFEKRRKRSSEKDMVMMRFRRDVHTQRPDMTVYDLMSGVMRDILDEDGDDDTEDIQKGFQDDFKTEIKTQRPCVAQLWTCLTEVLVQVVNHAQYGTLSKIVDLDIPSIFLNGNVSALSMFSNLKSISLGRESVSCLLGHDHCQKMQP